MSEEVEETGTHSEQCAILEGGYCNCLWGYAYYANHPELKKGAPANDNVEDEQIGRAHV